jgi:hypothetical protein
MPPTNTFFVDVHTTPVRYKQSSGALLSTSASKGPRRTDFAHEYTNAVAGSSPGTVVVVDDVDELEDVDAPFGIDVLVVEEFDPATVVVDSVGTWVLVVGNNVVGGRIVSPGATVATGLVGVVSPAAERLVVLLAQPTNSRPQARATATA